MCTYLIKSINSWNNHICIGSVVYKCMYCTSTCTYSNQHVYVFVLNSMCHILATFLFVILKVAFRDCAVCSWGVSVCVCETLVYALLLLSRIHCVRVLSLFYPYQPKSFCLLPKHYKICVCGDDTLIIFEQFN